MRQRFSRSHVGLDLNSFVLLKCYGDLPQKRLWGDKVMLVPRWGPNGVLQGAQPRAVGAWPPALVVLLRLGKGPQHLSGSGPRSEKLCGTPQDERFMATVLFLLLLQTHQ